MQNKSLTDEQLVLLIREGNREAFASLFHRYFPVVAAFCNGILKDPQLSEDMAQEVLLSLWVKRQDVFCTVGSLRQYLFTVSRNRVMSYLRSRYARSTVSLDASAAEVPCNGRADEKVIYDQLRGDLSKVLETMPQKRREVFLLSRKEGYSRKEIAREMEVSEATVKKHIELALDQIRSGGILKN